MRNFLQYSVVLPCDFLFKYYYLEICIKVAMLFREDIKTEKKGVALFCRKSFVCLPEEIDFIQRIMTLISQHYGFTKLILSSIFLSMISTNCPSGKY